MDDYDFTAGERAFCQGRGIAPGLPGDGTLGAGLTLTLPTIPVWNILETWWTLSFPGGFNAHRPRPIICASAHCTLVNFAVVVDISMDRVNFVVLRSANGTPGQIVRIVEVLPWAFARVRILNSGAVPDVFTVGVGTYSSWGMSSPLPGSSSSVAAAAAPVGP